MAYPYSRSETVADGTVHVLGLGIAIPAVTLLLINAAEHGVLIVATTIYSVSVVASLSASAIYVCGPGIGLGAGHPGRHSQALLLERGFQSVALSLPRDGLAFGSADLADVANHSGRGLAFDHNRWCDIFTGDDHLCSCRDAIPERLLARHRIDGDALPACRCHIERHTRSICSR